MGKGQAFQNGPGKTWLPYDIMELYPCLLPYNYINYKGIKKLNIKTRAIKPLEEDIELFFLPLVFAVSFWVSTKSKGNNCQNNMWNHIKFQRKEHQQNQMAIYRLTEDISKSYI